MATKIPQPEAPPLTDTERKRSALLSRFAELAGDEPGLKADVIVRDEATGWRFRDGFEQDLEAWEAARSARG